MSPATRIVASPPSGAGAWYVSWLAAEWPAVRVEEVEVVPGALGARVRAVVRAVVRLGGLTPADVRVELWPAAPAGDAPTRDAPPDAGRPMWTTQSYDNGCYVYEATLADGAATRSDDWRIRVRPRRPGVDLSPLPRP